MSDWQAGDLALCVKSSHTIESGSLNTVSDVVVAGPEWGQYEGAVGLFMEGRQAQSLTGAYRSDQFVKVTPNHDAETLEDRGIIALMNKEPNHVDR